MASTELTRTPSSTTNRKKFTISYWCKRTSISSNYPRICAYDYADSDRFEHFFNNVDQLYIEHVNNNSQDVHLVTSRKFKDTSAWYHIVVAFDTTQATASNRVKLYINGVQETDFTGTVTYPSQDSNMIVNYASGSVFYIGETGYSSGGQNFDGLISHFHFIDGTQYTASDFGSTDSTTGEWKINTSPSVTYGTNGFFILKDGNSVTDQSGNSNNFTVSGGTLTKTEDCPSNVFATFNPLVRTNSTTFSNGNTTLTSGSTQWNGAMTTIPLFGGKWYYECKYINGGNIKFDVVGNQSDYSNMATLNSSYGGYHGNGYGYQFNNSGNDYIGGNNSFPNWSGGLSSNTGDKIFMVALDLDNGYIWYGADGTWFNDANGDTGNPSTGAYPHQTITAQHLSEKPHIITGSVEGNSDVGHWNFGNGYFGTTAVSSAGNNASNLGIFEYDVPTGYTAVCTKGLNE